MSKLVDDKVLAKNVWIVSCSQCRNYIDPVLLKSLGHCPHCGHQKSGLRLMNAKERKAFLRGKMRVYYKTRGDRAGVTVAHHGLDSIPQNQIDWLRQAVTDAKKIQMAEVARRESILRKEELARPLPNIPYLPRQVVRILQRVRLLRRRKR